MCASTCGHEVVYCFKRLRQHSAAVSAYLRTYETPARSCLFKDTRRLFQAPAGTEAGLAYSKETDREKEREQERERAVVSA